MASKDKGKAPWWMLRNSRGKKDSMWTLTLVAFWITTLAYVASLVNVVQVGSTSVSFRAFDGLGYAAIVLVPLLGAYFGRRYTTEANETSMAKAELYAEVAKRKLEVARVGTVNIDKPSVKIDPNAVANSIHDAAEAEMARELEEPQDEV